ncbi:MAG: helix-turn-helix domain-containing protein [Blastocatellia bacterium]
MPTLGEELRNRREQRNITLAEISEATRIGSRFLKAIETDNFSILPGGIFTRSFIRAYAKHVGMNEDEAVALYLQQVAPGPALEQETADVAAIQQTSPADKPPKRPPPAEPVSKKPPAEDRSRRFEPAVFRPSTARTSWPTIVIGAGIVIFIVIIVVALVKQLNQGTVETGTQPSQVAQQNAPPRPSTQPPTQPAASQQPSTPASEIPAGQPLVVKLEAATGDSWIKYQVDDAKPTTMVLKQGQSQDLPPAQTQVTLNYGNRLTLKMKINNRDASFPPDTPKFKSQVVISRDNFQTYFQ